MWYRASTRVSISFPGGFDKAQQNDVDLAASLATGSFEEEVARVLLRHKATVVRRQNDGNMSLAGRHNHSSVLLASILTVTAGTAERGAAPLTVPQKHKHIICAERCDQLSGALHKPDSYAVTRRDACHDHCGMQDWSRC